MIKYGHEWAEGLSELTIELVCYNLALTPEQGGLGKVQHFRNVVNMLWNYEGSSQKFVWHPWVDAEMWDALGLPRQEGMMQSALEERFLGVAGCASSGKTDFFAIFPIVEFLADPVNTKCLVTSTTLKDSKLRIWGRIREYWLAAQKKFPDLPGKLVDTSGILRYVDPETGNDFDTAGISLLAGDQSKEKETIGKMIGFKRGRVILIADEMPELSPAILEAAMTNLVSNPSFKFIGIGNPNSYYDAFGVFTKPFSGYASVKENDLRWETDLGVCIRFDAERSPNIILGEDRWPWLPTAKKIAEAHGRMDQNSPGYWRMYRGFYCPTGSALAIYTGPQFEMCGATSREVVWKGEVHRVAFLDPSFSIGGDDAIVALGWYGETVAGLNTVLFDRDTVALTASVSDPDPLNNQLVKKLKALCEKEGVLPQNLGVDSTGGGGPFCDLIATLWTKDFYRCYFGGSPSDAPVSQADPRPGHQAFTNRISELWYFGVPLLRAGQLRGVGSAMIREATARQYVTYKGPHGEMIEVESKKKFRKRLNNKSPNIADACFGVLDLCRVRLGLTAKERIKQTELKKKPVRPSKGFVLGGVRMNPAFGGLRVSGRSLDSGSGRGMRKLR